MDHAEGSNGLEPTLLIKASTLLLKYVVLGARMQFHLARIENRLLYACTIVDDESKPAMLWSVVESESELDALREVLSSHPVVVVLFNELAVNVAWSTLKIVIPEAVAEWVASSATGHVDYPLVSDRAVSLLDAAYRGTASSSKAVTVNVEVIGSWTPVLSHFITSHGTSSPIRLFSRDEGGQQEQLVVWLTDTLHPRGVHHSPQIPNGSGTRELIDIVLSHEYGAFLIESKALTVFNRDSLPDRAKLSRAIAQHVKKATRQLWGGIRRLKAGVTVTSCSGSPIEVERSKPMHAIVLIPDLALIEDPSQYGPEFIASFMKATGGFVHLLDVAELLRVIQAAEKISADSPQITPLMALDYYLIERAEKARESNTLCIQVVLRIN